MICMGIDAAGRTAGVALTKDGQLLYECFVNGGLSHSETLMGLVDGAFKATGLAPTDLDLYGVCAGPGSFTGLRIGVSAAKGLAWAKGLPCCGVSTLEAMARGVSDFDGLIVCAMDARRQQIYHALFRSENGQLTRLCDDCAIGLEELVDHLRRLPQPKLVVGDGAQLCYDHLTAAGISCRLASPDHRFQNAAGAALAAADMARTGHTCTAQELQPVYLRLSQAERERLAKGLSLTE